MPSIFLSPSLQPYNAYYSEGNEQYYMNQIADAMEPYLISNGIQFNRNEIGTSLRNSINSSNAGSYDLHLAIHSNASPESLAGTLTGTDVYYSPNSFQGQEAAAIIAENYKNVYYQPDNVKAVPTTSLSEINLTNAPAVLIETAYHDNPTDEAWIKNNINNIAANLVESLTYFFDIPFVSTPTVPIMGYVNTDGSNLRIREKPDFDAPVLITAPNEATLLVLGQWNNWYVIEYNDVFGYAFADYIVTQ